MRHHCLTVARSAYKPSQLIHPLPSQPCKPCTLVASPIPFPRAHLSARACVELPDLKHRRQSTFGRSRMSSVDTSPSAQTPDGFFFGPYKIGLEEVFLTTKLSFAFVNLRPVVPEVTDLWLTAQRVGAKMESFWDRRSLTLTIQDGSDAGQTVPHVHVHVLPRKEGDFKNNDDIYDEIDKKEKELGDNLNLDQEKKDRTPEMMKEEATQLRALF